MASKVQRFQAALRDLEEQAAYFIEEASLDVALRFLEAAEQAFRTLSEMPEIGAPRQSLHPQLLDLRMWPIPEFPNHLVFYHRTEDGIAVVRVLHAKRDVGGILGAE